MIYTCSHCQAWFPADALSKALKNKENFIRCAYCGMPTELPEVKSSNIGKGYDYLSVGKFFEAMSSFQHAIDDSLKHEKHPSSDAYLGMALAQFRVQTVFSDEEQIEFPQLTCYGCNEIYFSDSDAFMHALEGVKEAGKEFKSELDKLNRYSNYIDDVKDNYARIKESKPRGFSYGAFVAYDDSIQDSTNRDFEFAHSVRNSLPSGIKDVFIPDIDQYATLPEYEAAILFAIEHSKCMLVITGNEISSRLVDIYSRFYYNNSQKGAINNLGFVRYGDHITISLPNEKRASSKYIFDIDGRQEYIDFVNSNNGIVSSRRQTVPAQPVTQTRTERAAVEDKNAYSYVGEQIRIGSYPQRLEQSAEVNEYFKSFEKPKPSDSKGWSVLLTNKKGTPYTWYRDEEINGKKYRGVYFLKFRDVYSVQNSDIKATNQTEHKYYIGRIYCFAFEPIIWNVKNTVSGLTELVADMGLDSMAFNRAEMNGSWEESTLRAWLNEDFLTTAFSEKEQAILCTIEGMDDRVYMLDKEYDKEYYKENRRAILGSDYFKCMGGMGDRTINCYWIISNNVPGSREASVVFSGGSNDGASQYVDRSDVAVMPKIIVKL